MPNNSETKTITIIGEKNIVYGKKGGRGHASTKKNKNTKEIVQIGKEKTKEEESTQITPVITKTLEATKTIKLNRKTPKLISLNKRKFSAGKIPLKNTNARITQKKKKIILNISSLKNKVSKTQKIREKIQKAPIEELKKELIQRGVLKPNSKAPDSIIRQIAIDTNIIGTIGL